MPEKTVDEIVAEAEAQGYHVPSRKKPETDAGYFELLTKSVFQAGFSWEVIRNKWPNFQKAFDNFDVDTVARYDMRDIDRLVNDASIVRNGRKIEATVHNARTMQTIIQKHGSFHDYLRSMDGWDYPEKKKALKKAFKWLGDTGVFVFLWSVEESVPDWHDR